MQGSPGLDLHSCGGNHFEAAVSVWSRDSTLPAGTGHECLTLDETRVPHKRQHTPATTRARGRRSQLSEEHACENHDRYRGTSLIKKRLLLRPYSRPVHRAL